VEQCTDGREVEDLLHQGNVVFDTVDDLHNELVGIRVIVRRDGEAMHSERGDVNIGDVARVETA